MCKPNLMPGRGGSALASLGLARYKSRTPDASGRGGTPCRPRTPDASGRGGTPCRPHYLATAYNGRLGEASLPRDHLTLPTPPLVGAALRAVRAHRTPRRGVPTNTASGRGGTPCRPHYLAAAHYLNTHRIANGHSSASLQSHLRTGFFAT